MKHKAVRVDNLMYKGCEPHWKCTICGDCVPFHCYTREEFEQQECKGQNNKSLQKAKLNNCEHIIGMLNNYDDSDVVTLKELIQYINNANELTQYCKENNLPEFKYRKFISLKDYCDKRKSTDLTRFEYCPLCGKKIDWKGIKNE